jgi:hypothetical protein
MWNKAFWSSVTRVLRVVGSRRRDVRISMNQAHYASSTVPKPVVAIPVRNEAERLPALIAALASQTWLTRSDDHLDAVFVLNNCDDDSSRILKLVSECFPRLALHVIDVDLPTERAHVGCARRLAMDAALKIGGGAAVLMTTDADAVPMPNWISANLAAIDAGADLVGGYLIGDKDEEALLGPGFVQRATRHVYYTHLLDKLAALIDPVPHDPWPRHSDHTGASLAVRGAVYAAVGGIPELPFREDIAFVAEVCRAGYRLRHPFDVQVVVSARLDGRAAGGMADCLKVWVAAEEKGEPLLVEDPVAAATRLRRRRLYRDTKSLLIGQNGTNPIWYRPAFAIDAKPPIDRRLDIEAAIEKMERLIVDTEGSIRVA